MSKKPFVIPDNTIGSRIDAIISHFNTNIRDFAHSIGYSQSNISQVRLGARKDTKRLINSICNKYATSETWLSTGVGEMFAAESKQLQPLPEDYKQADIYHMAGAGMPYQLIESEPIDTLWLKKEFLNNHIVVVKVKGHSMEPTIMDGAYLGVDVADHQIVSGEMYALWIPYEGAIVKRINVDPRGTIQIISDNADSKRYPTVSLEPKELDENFIQGRVRWVIQKF